MPLSKAFTAATLSALTLAALSLPALADEASTIIFQQADPLPVTSTTVEKSTLIQQESMPEVAPLPGISPSIPAPVTLVPDDGTVVERAVQIQHTMPATTTSTTMIMDGPRLPEFRRRISLLQEQIDMGLSRGWLSGQQAGLFKQQANNLMSTAQSLGTLYDQAIADDLEKQINGLNINLSDAMSHGTSIATPPGVFK